MGFRLDIFSVAILQTAPASMAGVIGAMFYVALQLGSAVGLAAAISIETSVEAWRGGPTKYDGRAAALWFVLGTIAITASAVLWFYHRTSDHQGQLEPNLEDTNDEILQGAKKN